MGKKIYNSFRNIAINPQKLNFFSFHSFSTSMFFNSKCFFQRFYSISLKKINYLAPHLMANPSSVYALSPDSSKPRSIYLVMNQRPFLQSEILTGDKGLRAVTDLCSLSSILTDGVSGSRVENHMKAIKEPLGIC